MAHPQWPSTLITNPVLGLGLTDAKLEPYDFDVQQVTWAMPDWPEPFSITADLIVDGQSLKGKQFTSIQVVEHRQIVLERMENDKIVETYTFALESYTLRPTSRTVSKQ